MAFPAWQTGLCTNVLKVSKLRTWSLVSVGYNKVGENHDPYKFF